MSDCIPTFADVCSAIADGSIVATLDGTMYRINALELRRYLNKFRPLPSLSTAPTHTPSPCGDLGNWSGPTRTSVA